MSDLRARLQMSLGTAYTIERELGGGGMSRVFLAEETGLGRAIVVKVLPPDAAETLSAERFKREIAVAAKLQHPHIVPLLSAGEMEGLPFYIMPYVEGESLRARLARDGELSLAEAVSVLRDVARALAYAHSRGVVHRDIKPDNVLLTGEAAVVTDFGVAKAVSAAATNGDRTTLTQLGVALGTPAYMAPEQVAAEPTVDHRADLYAFGCTAYEILTGQPPFTGRPAAALLAAQVAELPEPLARRRPNVPPALAALVMQCLEKRPSDRPRDALAILQALQSSGFGAMTPAGYAAAGTTAGSVGPAQGGAARPWLARLRPGAPWILAAAALAMAGVTAAVARVPHVHSAPTVRFSIAMGEGVTFEPTLASLAVSADGARIVLVGFNGGQAGGPSALYIRALDDPQLRPIPGTEGAVAPFLSPDGMWVGFYRVSTGQLVKVPVEGGAPQIIASIPSRVAATWGANDVIVFSRPGGSPLWRVAATGGVPRPLTTLDAARGETAHVQPHFTPDGKLVVFSNFVRGRFQVAVTDLEGRVTRFALDGFDAQVVAPSYLVYSNIEGTVSAAGFDLRRRAIAGPAVPVLDGVYTADGGLRPNFAASPGGTIVYLRGLRTGRLAVVGPGGEVRVLAGEPRQLRHVRVSPDGARILTEIKENGGNDVWTYDVATGAFARVTFDGRSSDPVWSPDGRRIAFARTDLHDGSADVYWIPADGGGPPTLLAGGAGSQWPDAWAPDGRTFYFDERVGGEAMHVSAVDEAGPRRTVVANEFTNRLAAVSPDGRWLAYTSRETGRYEVYVRSTSGGGKWMVSTEGGTQPVWSRDGHTLYYRDAAHIMAATLRMSPSFAVAQRTPFAADQFLVERGTNYDASPDGKHLVVIRPTDAGLQLTVVVNWTRELQRRLAAGKDARER